MSVRPQTWIHRFLLLALLGVAPLGRAANECARSLGDLLHFNSEAQVLRSTERFPLGVDPSTHPGELIQFGFESEYGLDEIAGILKVYGPDEEFGISKTQWLSRTDEERMSFVRENIAKLFPQKRKKGKLVKLISDDSFKNLPDRIIQDETGNIEIIVGPLDSLEAWYKVVKNTNQAFGAGSMQSTVSVSRKVFFGELGAGIEENAVLENFGFLKFFSEYDALQKLAGAYSKYNEDPTKEVAKSFNHPFLGPTNAAKEARLLRDLRSNERGEGFSQRHLSQISGSDASYKYSGATVYRPDIAGPDRIVLEVRDAHKDFVRLTDKVLRTTYYLQNSRGQFREASRMKAFDAEVFGTLPGDVQTLLKTVYPNKAKPGVDYGEEEMRALAVYRNFAWPLRDWSGHLAFVGREDLVSQVAAAQAEYQKTLKMLAASRPDLNNREIKSQVSADVQGALAKFAQESGLAKAFDEKYKSLQDGVSVRKFQEDAAIEVGALKTAFPERVWQGELTDRAQRFAAKWPTAAKIHSGVTFGRSTQKRQVLEISLKGLSEEQQGALLKDYFQAMSLNTVSFPMGENVNHLHTRIGNHDMDWFGWKNLEPYSLTDSTRMEPVLLLSPEEQMRMRVYMDNIMKRGERVVGDSNYDGATSGVTRGKLDDNRVLTAGEGHNCTSVICLAPVGDRGETLLSLAGGTISSKEKHVIPGRWGQHLAEEAPSERVPLIVYWTSKATRAPLPLKKGANITQWSWDNH